MAIDIRHYKGLNNTPALALALRGWLENVEKGQGDGCLNAYWSYSAFVAFCESATGDMTPVGVTTFDFQEHSREIFIFQSFVLPPWRGHGIYSALWDAVVEKGKELKAGSICSGTSPSNAAMRAIAAKQGRKESGITLRFDLPVQS